MTPTGTAKTSRSADRSGLIARLLPVGIAVLGLAELGILIWIGVATSLWWSLLIIAIGWIIGFALVVAAGQQSFIRLRSLVRAFRGRGDVQDHLSRPAFTLLAAGCFFFPGLITDVLGIILLLTPVQRRTMTKMGVPSGSDAARRVLYRTPRAGGVLEGEIIVEAQPTTPRPSSAGPSGTAGNGPTIEGTLKD